jgi:hypothetical protein
VAIIRGAWDALIPDSDARWLFDAFKAAPSKRDVKISRATHLMHLEAMRHALYRETLAFLEGETCGAVPRLGGHGSRHQEGSRPMHPATETKKPDSQIPDAP